MSTPSSQDPISRQQEEHALRKLMPEEQITEHMTSRLKEMMRQIPAYSSLSIEVCLPSIDGPPEINVKAYSGPLGFSARHGTFSDAMNELLTQADGKTESQLLREKAARMIAHAELLESRNPKQEAA